MNQPYPVPRVPTLTQHEEWSCVGRYSETSCWRDQIGGNIAKIIRQNVPLSVTPIGSQGRKTATAWAVKEGGPEEAGVQQ